MSLVQLCEFCPGLVVFMDPEKARGYEASGPCNVRGVHPFVCLSEANDMCVFVALTSKPGRPRRFRLDRQYKHGHDRWVGRDAYLYGRDQWLEGPLHAFQEASADTEYSQPHDRNSVTPECLGRIQKLIAYNG